MPEFLVADWLGTPVWFWGAFLAIVVVLTAFDLGFLHKEDRELGIAESLKLSVFYITVALLFGVWVWFERGETASMQYFTGFFIEKALSIDNVFVISLIFTYFAIPAKYQYRALLWGIIAVIILVRRPKHIKIFRLYIIVDNTTHIVQVSNTGEVSTK